MVFHPGVGDKNPVWRYPISRDNTVVRYLAGERVGVFCYFTFDFGWFGSLELDFLFEFWVGVGLYWGALRVFILFYPIWHYYTCTFSYKVVRYA